MLLAPSQPCSVDVTMILTCVMPKKRYFTCPTFVYTMQRNLPIDIYIFLIITNCYLVDMLRDSSTIIANNESPRSLIIAFIVSITAVLLFLFGYQERSFDDFQGHFQGLPYQFLHCAFQETVIIQENFLDYWSLQIHRGRKMLVLIVVENKYSPLMHSNKFNIPFSQDLIACL